MQPVQISGGSLMNNISVTQWYHQFIRSQVMPGDLCIDATMGNGNDTALLCRLAGPSGHVIAFDIQEQALVSTRSLLEELGLLSNCRLLLASHETMDQYAVAGTVSCITFNLGYLPGGDHHTCTRSESSLIAIRSGLELLKPGGLMTICIYRGHASGSDEADVILSFLQSLDCKKYLVIQSEYINRPNLPPIPVLVIKL